jgi:predicted metal-dependent phosphoesterase TrpH
MGYRVDFHTHTGHSKDSLLSAARLLTAAARRGLAAVAVTDHNSLGGALQALDLAERQAERFRGVRVLPGTEVMTSEGEIIGLLVRKEVPRGLSAEETIRRIREQGGLVLLPHPFDRIRGSRLQQPAAERVAHLLDAVEAVNARTSLARDNAAARAFAEQHGLALVAGSDAHTAGEVGRAYLDLDEPPSGEPARLLEQIRRGRVRGGLSAPTVHVSSKLATWRKKLGLAPLVQL